jgi:hypothetical protein
MKRLPDPAQHDLGLSPSRSLQPLPKAAIHTELEAHSRCQEAVDTGEGVQGVAGDARGAHGVEQQPVLPEEPLSAISAWSVVVFVGCLRRRRAGPPLRRRSRDERYNYNTTT